jgi:FAD/FMN-containing dehydrogenase
VRCSDAEDVIRAIGFAGENELLIALHGGGHSFAGYGVCDAGIVIDLSPIKQAIINPAKQSIQIGAGIEGDELNCLAQAFKMAVPLGSCPSVGVVSYAIAGGTSSLTPKFGYACDSISRAEIVTAAGRKLVTTEEERQDLFWALRGAGANFGVVTSLEFRLHPVQQVLSGHLRYPVRQAAKVLAFIQDYAPSVPNDLFLIVAVLPHPGERMLDVGIVWPGKPEQGERALRPLRKFLKPFQDTVAVRDYLDEQRAGSDSPGDGDYSSRRRGGHLENLSGEVIDVILEHAFNAPTEASGISMIYWHGPWCSRPRDDAFGFRRTGYHYWIHSYWRGARDDRKATEWVYKFFSALKPHSSDAVYVNDLEDEGAERVRAAYGNKYERLQQLKRKYDPTNLFRVNQNIIPAP